LNSVNLSVPVL